MPLFATKPVEKAELSGIENTPNFEKCPSLANLNWVRKKYFENMISGLKPYLEWPWGDEILENDMTE